MDYQKYIQRILDFLVKLTFAQRFFASIGLLIIIGGGIFLYNPQKKMLEMRNSQRRSDVVNILNAVYQFRTENNGKLPAGITSQPTMICRSKAASCEGLVDISEILKDEKRILSKVPTDPKEQNPNSSGYQIHLSSNGRINVAAPLAENNAAINLSK